MSKVYIIVFLPFQKIKKNPTVIPKVFSCFVFLLITGKSNLDLK